MSPRSDSVRRAFRAVAMRRVKSVTIGLAVAAAANVTGSAFAQAPASAGRSSPQLTVLTNDSYLPPPPAPPVAGALTEPSAVLCPPNQMSYQAALTGCSTDQQPCIDFFGFNTPAIFPWSLEPPEDTTTPTGSASAGNGGGPTPGGRGPEQNFNLSKAGANYKTRVQASSSIAESHAPGHHRQAEQPTPAQKEAAAAVMRTMLAPMAASRAMGGGGGGGGGGPAGDGGSPAFPFNLFSGMTFETNYSARAAVYEDTTRMGSQAAAGFLPSAIPVENQPFFGGPARTTVQGSGSSISFQLNDSPTPDFNIITYANLVAIADSSDTAASGVGLQQAFIQVNNLVLGSMETAFADNDALPPTLDFLGPNARVTVFNTVSSVQGQGRLSYWLHQLPQDRASVGYAINTSVEQPIPEIISGGTPTKPTTTFARFPDVIGTFKIGEMVEAPTDKPGDKNKEFYEAWHVQAGGIVRSLGLESFNDSIDESAFGWGVSLNGHYTFAVPCTILPDAVFASATYGVGIAHYIGDLHSTSLTASGNDAILDGTYLRPLPELAYYAGYLHNWSNHWRSLVCYSHVTLDSQGQSIKTLYRYGDYASANIEWHRLVNGAKDMMTGNPSMYDFNLGLEYIYGRFEELSGASGQDQRISLVAALNK